jgi:hypothetical protein
VERLEQPGRHGGGVALVQPAEQHPEAVTPQPGHDVTAAGGGGEPAGQVGQRRVTEAVPELVVDAREAGDGDDQHSRGMTCCQRRVHQPQEGGAVQQARQGVVGGPVVQLAGQLLLRLLRRPHLVVASHRRAQRVRTRLAVSARHCAPADDSASTRPRHARRSSRCVGTVVRAEAPRRRPAAGAARAAAPQAHGRRRAPRAHRRRRQHEGPSGRRHEQPSSSRRVRRGGAGISRSRRGVAAVSHGRQNGGDPPRRGAGRTSRTPRPGVIGAAARAPASSPCRRLRGVERTVGVPQQLLRGHARRRAARSRCSRRSRRAGRAR